jgi:tryptophan synthase beta chain
MLRPSSYNEPDPKGRFGTFGGQYVPETLMPLVLELNEAWQTARGDEAFWAEYHSLLKFFVGRPSPLYHAERLSQRFGAKIYLKREELNHTGAHKINNCIGQILLAQRMGRKRIIAETGAGQHGVASATVCARFDLPCVVYMGAKDVERQKPNVFRMTLMGAEVVSVSSGNGTLKDALNEALRDWVSNVDDTYYMIGTAAGMHPYPEMVREFQTVIGKETRQQILELEGRLPDALVACIGGGSNAIGMFHPFIDDEGVKIFGVEAAGRGLGVYNGHSASLNGGRPGILHGNRTYLLQDEDGQILDGHSISAGLDYPGIGPEHAHLFDLGRATYLTATDEEALEAFQFTAQLEGIIPALESSHAIARLDEVAQQVGKDGLIVLNLSGRGDKDIFTVADALGANAGS